MMNKKKEEDAKSIQKSIDNIIGSKTTLKRKRKTENEINKEKFEKIITDLQNANARTLLLGSELNIDLSNYNELFYNTIDSLFEMHFGTECASVIFYYLYDRFREDGSINELRDSENNIIHLNNAGDLYELLQFMKSKKQ